MRQRVPREKPSGTTLMLCFGQIDPTQQQRKLFVTQHDLALGITGLRPGETPLLQPLGTDPQDVFIMPLFTMWLISRELTGPKTVPWGRVFRAVRDQVDA